MRVLVTGGAGFIGSAVVRHFLGGQAAVINVDKLTYAGHPATLTGLEADPRHQLEQVDICAAEKIAELFDRYQPDAVVHLAAETHVDRSIAAPDAFVQTNVVGTRVLLDQALGYWQSLTGTKQEKFRFLHVSTDEVYGDLGPDDAPFTEADRYAPSSPYAASKAASDHLVRAWYRTYGLPVLITNCSNNYGPFQYPEKLIPLMIFNALEGRVLPIYGDGTNVRDWLHVEDHAIALARVLAEGIPGETYHIGARCERSNNDVVQNICQAVAEHTNVPLAHYQALIAHVADRPGHDRRYAIDASKLCTELGWTPRYQFEAGLRATVTWYLNNLAWVKAVSGVDYTNWIRQNYDARGSIGGTS